MSVNVTDNSINDVLSSSGVVVLDFWAQWCGPCKAYGPIVDKFSEENKHIFVGKVNIDESGEIAAAYGIRSIPTTIIFKDGQLITKVTGIIQKDKLTQLTKPLT